MKTSNQLLPKEEDLSPSHKRLTEGEQNVLNARLIDMLIEGESQTNLVRYVKDYYLNTTGKQIKNPYINIQTAKNLWLSNINLPTLENYKKEKMLQMQHYTERITTESEKDIVDQVKVIVDVNKYTDNIIGLNDNSGNDINIAVNIDRKQIIDALEMNDEVIDIKPEPTI